MSALTIVWTMFATASFVLAMIHLLLWFKDRPSRVYLLCALMALAAAANAFIELDLMRAESL